GGQGACQRRVRVSVNQQTVRTFSQEEGFDAAEHRGGLSAMRPGANTEIHVGRRNLEAIEKDAGHLIVIMLSGVHQDLSVARAESSTDGCRFDELWPGPYNRYDLHWCCGSLPWPRLQCTALRCQSSGGPLLAVLSLCNRVEHRVDDAALAIEGQGGEHRQRKDLQGSFLGDSEIARTEEQTRVCLG